jgi:hypothetical protein
MAPERVRLRGRDPRIEASAKRGLAHLALWSTGCMLGLRLAPEYGGRTCPAPALGRRCVDLNGPRPAHASGAVHVYLRPWPFPGSPCPADLAGSCRCLDCAAARTRLVQSADPCRRGRRPPHHAAVPTPHGGRVPGACRAARWLRGRVHGGGPAGHGRAAGHLPRTDRTRPPWVPSALFPVGCKRWAAASSALLGNTSEPSLREVAARHAVERLTAFRLLG